MNMEEYQKVKDFTYLEYCDYLQQKYGIGLADFMTRSFNKNPKVTRTKEGLLAHHKMEDRMIMLSTKEFAQACPFEWQQKENIVYCDYLEHLLLHVLICEYPSEDIMYGAKVGYGGVVNFIAPELNDFYSGWITNQSWRKTCHDKIANDKDVYFAILKKFILWELRINPKFNIETLFTSFNESFGLWRKENNKKIFTEINEIYKSCL